MKTLNTDIKVKDIIIFLQQFDPETPVYLDRDGWKNYGDNNTIKKNDVIRYVFDDSSITHRGGNSITINN